MSSLSSHFDCSLYHLITIDLHFAYINFVFLFHFIFNLIFAFSIDILVLLLCLFLVINLLIQFSSFLAVLCCPNIFLFLIYLLEAVVFLFFICLLFLKNFIMIGIMFSAFLNFLFYLISQMSLYYQFNLASVID
jgi:hypothetical protein